MRALLATLSLIFAINCHAASDEICLAVALFHEANTEPMKSKRAVYDVINSRMLDNGKSACDTIRERNAFSFVRRNTSWRVTDEMTEQLYEVMMMPRVLDERYKYFFNKHLHPVWAKKMVCRVVGEHKYCRDK